MGDDRVTGSELGLDRLLAVSGQSGTLIGQGSVTIVFADADYLPLGFIFLFSTMGSIDSLKSILTQSTLDDLCEKYYIPDAFHPELPGPNSRIRRSPTGKINLSVIAAAKVSHFEILCRVHGFVPTMGNFRSAKSLRKDPPPAPDEFSAEVCNFLADNPAPFKKFLEAFLCLVGISRYYTLDENSYPTFWDDEDEGAEMDLFAFIHHADPTKVKIREREIREVEIPLLELTKDRVVLLACVYNQGDVAASGGIEILADDEAQAIVVDKPKKLKRRKTIDGGSGLPPKKLREDHSTSGDASATTARKSLAVLQDLLDKSKLATMVGATAAATILLITSSVARIPEHEGGKYDDSVSVANVRTRRPAERFVNVATTVVTGTSIPRPKDVNEATHALHQAYVPKWDVLNDSLLDDSNVCRSVVDQLAPPVFFSQLRAMGYDQLLSEFNVGAARQTCLSAEVRMRMKHLLRGKKRLEGKCGTQDKLLKKRDLEIADLKARLYLKEAEEDARAYELGSLKEQSVSSLEVTCSELRGEVSGYQLFKERIKEMQDAQVKVLSDRVASVDSDLMALALHMDEEFYPRFLTTLAECRWILSRDARLLVVKCLHSPEYMTALGGAISRAIEKGMQDGLVADIDHSQATRVLADVVAYDPFAEANYIAAISSAAETLKGLLLQPLPEQLMVPIYRLEDQVVIGEISLSDSLEVAHNRVQRLKGDATACRLSLTDVMIPLVEPVSFRGLTSEVSTFEVPTTFHVHGRMFPLWSLSLYAPFPKASVTSYGPSHLGPSLPPSSAWLALLFR
ncbi:hypothetical protein Tco_0489052 [Tanacetum coccineum]